MLGQYGRGVFDNIMFTTCMYSLITNLKTPISNSLVSDRILRITCLHKSNTTINLCSIYLPTKEPNSNCRGSKVLIPTYFYFAKMFYRFLVDLYKIHNTHFFILLKLMLLSIRKLFFDKEIFENFCKVSP